MNGQITYDGFGGRPSVGGIEAGADPTGPPGCLALPGGPVF